MKDKWKTNDTAAFEARLYDMLGIATVEDDDDEDEDEEDDLLQLIVEDRRIKQRLAGLEGQLLAEQEDARLLAAELKKQKKAATEEIQSLAESNIFLRNRVDDLNKDKAILNKELDACGERNIQRGHEIDGLKRQAKAFEEQGRSLAMKNDYLQKIVDDINKKANGCATVLGEKRGTIHRIIDALGIEAEVYDCRKIVDAITKLKAVIKEQQAEIKKLKAACPWNGERESADGRVVTCYGGKGEEVTNVVFAQIADDLDEWIMERSRIFERLLACLGLPAGTFDGYKIGSAGDKIIDAITKLKEEKDLLRARLEPYEAVYDKLMAGVMGRRHLKAPIGDKIATLMLVVEALGIDANICDRDKIIDAIEKLKAVCARVRFEDGLESKVGQGESFFLVDLDKKGKVKGQVSVTVS